MCSSFYDISTIIGSEAIGNQEFIKISSKLCGKSESIY